MDLDQDRPSNLQVLQVQRPISGVKWNSSVVLDNVLSLQSKMMLLRKKLCLLLVFFQQTYNLGLLSPHLGYTIKK